MTAPTLAADLATENRTGTTEPPRPQAFGDCDSCGHSIVYHAPVVGCLKCDCDEYQ